MLENAWARAEELLALADWVEPLPLSACCTSAWLREPSELLSKDEIS